MQTITTIGLDIAKSVFQVHGVDAAGQVVIRRQLKRRYVALVASVGDPKSFRSGRNLSAWIGLVPKQHSSGGRERLGSTSKQGDRYLRSLFVAGALAVIRYAKLHGSNHRPWVTALLARRPTKVAAIALAKSLREWPGP